MNAITTTSGGNVLVPENMDQAMRLATAMANAKMVPKHLQQDVGSCLMVVEQAMRWRASPFAVAQCTSNIGGKLAYEGKLIAAILPSCGAIVGELNYEYHGDPKKPEGLSVTVSGIRASDGEVKTIDLEWIMAKTENKYWTIQPEQQLCYAGARVWARRWTPGPLLGVYAPEEFSAGKVDTFDGTTVEARAEPPVTAAPTVADWFKSLDVDLANALDKDAVDAILARPDVQKMQDDHTRPKAQGRLQFMLDAAIKRTEIVIEGDTGFDLDDDDGIDTPSGPGLEPSGDENRYEWEAQVNVMLSDLGRQNSISLPAFLKTQDYIDFVTALSTSPHKDLFVRVRDAVQAANAR